MCLAVVLVGSAIVFALPTVAQQVQPIPDEQDREKLDAMIRTFDEAWNNNDAAALASLAK
jgi:hypothetical protein